MAPSCRFKFNKQLLTIFPLVGSSSFFCRITSLCEHGTDGEQNSGYLGKKNSKMMLFQVKSECHSFTFGVQLYVVSLMFAEMT